MPLEQYPQPGYELLDDRVPVWRFMKMKTFRRFIESGNLYFCRADLFDDENEGLPLEEFVRQAVANMGEGHSFNDTWQMLKDDRQTSFISCWTLDESIHMWEKFAPAGVAVESRCGPLSAALDAMQGRTMVGMVRYSLKHEAFNILRFITAKRPEFSPEREVRAFVWNTEEGPRHPYPYVRRIGISYEVDIPALVLRIIVSPTAPDATHEEVERLLANKGYTISVTKSAYTGYSHLLATAEEIKRFSRG